MTSAASVGHRDKDTKGPRWDLVAAHVARFGVKAVSLLFLPFPRRHKVTFLTREHSSEPLDFRMLREQLQEADPSLSIVVKAGILPPGIIGKLRFGVNTVAEAYHVATSRVVILDGYSVIASMGLRRKGLTVVQIWHALGAMKKFGLSIVGQGEGRDPRLAKAMRMHEGYDLVIASAELCRAPYAEAFGVDIEKVVVAPLPRVSYLQDEAVKLSVRARFFEAFPELQDKKIALYAPTFRTSGETVVPPHEVAAALREAGYEPVVKLHPLEATGRSDTEFTAPGFTTQDLLFVADVFVTDYSSALFEAAVAGVPCYLFAPDLDEYLASRDFYLNYPTDLGLSAATAPAELSNMLIAQGTPRASRVRRYVDAETTSSRLIDLVGDSVGMRFDKSRDPNFKENLD